MEVLSLIDELDNLLFQAKSIPLSGQVRVDRDEAFRLLDEIRKALPEDLKHARWIVEERREWVDVDRDGNDLRGIRAELEQLRRAANAPQAPLTEAASAQVKEILGAAERSAAEIRARAEREAMAVTEGALRIQREASRRAAERTADEIARIEAAAGEVEDEAAQAASALEDLLDALRTPASALAEALDSSADKVRREIEALKARLGVTALPPAPVAGDGEHADAGPVPAAVPASGDGTGDDAVDDGGAGTERQAFDGSDVDDGGFFDLGPREFGGPVFERELPGDDDVISAQRTADDEFVDDARPTGEIY